jgi:hypothetical protein
VGWHGILFSGVFPHGEGLAVNLALNLVLLFIGAGGAIVSAFTLPNSRAKWVCVSAFGVAGLAGFALSIITYEQTTIWAVAGAIWGAWQTIWASIIAFAQRRWVQLLIVLAIGVALGVIGPREYQKRTRFWHDKQDIEIHFANPLLVNAREEAKEKIRKLNMAFLDLTVEEQNLHRGGPGAMMEESPERISIRMRRVALHDALKQAQEDLSSAFQGVLVDLQNKLQKGKLISKGFSYDAGINSGEIDIPASYWRFLEFSPDYINASGRGVSYTAIVVARSGIWA